MGKIWLISDLHLCHQQQFIYSPRGFNNVYSHNEAIIENWNNTVQMEDDVYLLGDLMLNDNDEGMRLLKQLKGNIHIIRGNHDSDNRAELYNTLWNVVEICDGKFLNYKNYHFYLSHYPCLCDNYDNDKPLKAKMISICGHRHCKDKFYDMEYGLIYHVDADAHNCTPVCIDDIIEEIKEYVAEKEK